MTLCDRDRGSPVSVRARSRAPLSPCGLLALVAPSPNGKPSQLGHWTSLTFSPVAPPHRTWQAIEAIDRENGELRSRRASAHRRSVRARSPKRKSVFSTGNVAYRHCKSAVSLTRSAVGRRYAGLGVSARRRWAYEGLDTAQRWG